MEKSFRKFSQRGTKKEEKKVLFCPKLEKKKVGKKTKREK